MNAILPTGYEPAQSCTDLLAAMVNIDTVNAAISGRPDAEMGLVLYLEQQAQALGLATQRLAVDEQVCNLLVSLPAPAADRPWLLFDSHMDTVGVEQMSIPPFAGRVADGRVFGRGACDTKGSGAAMLWALARYAREPGANNVAILFNVDEEVSKRGVTRFITAHLPSLPWRPAGVIVGEPTLLSPVVAHNGVVRWAIRTHGLAAHSSNPASGRSAVSLMRQVLDVIEDQYIPSLSASHPLTGKAQCSVNLIRGGEQINIIPAACEIQIDRRVVPGEDPYLVLPEVQRRLDQAGLSREQVSQLQPFVDPPMDPAVGQAFANVVRQTLAGMNLPAETLGVGYGTNASSYTQAGIPAVVLGPGSIEQAHTRDEWLCLSQLEQAVAVYHALMCQTLA